MSPIDRCWRQKVATPLRGFLGCGRGSIAVEFSLLAFPFIALLIGVVQFYMVYVMQTTLSDTLYQSASSPELILLSGDKAGYTDIICKKVAFPAMCTGTTLKLEMQPLQNAPTAQTSITGGTFDAGTSNDVLLLRASITVTSLLPFIPTMSAQASAIFRRPVS